MTSVRLPYIHRFRDRHGHLRLYFRKPGFPRVTLPGKLGSPEFLRAYEDASAGRAISDVAKTDRAAIGSMSALIQSYYRTAEFKALRVSTQGVYRNVLAAFAKEHGGKLVEDLRAKHVRSILATKSDTPAAANRILSILRILIRHAIENEQIDNDPTNGVRRLKERGDGFHSWTEDEIARYEARHVIGSAARLAFSLLLFTGQRRGDVVRLGPADMKDGRIAVVQGKTGAKLALSVHPVLREVIAASTIGLSSFLVTAYGRPFTPAGFGNRFREWCSEAGLPDRCSAHGLRKAAARRLAEAGCSPHEIASVTGHATLAEVQRYAKAADQVRLNEAAMRRLGERPAS